MGQLEDMALFKRIVEAGGISKAAEQMHLAKSAVSRRLGELEQRLGTQLLSRTTRKSSLTEAGTLYYRRAQNILDEVDALNEETAGITTTLGGTLKLTAPLSFSLAQLQPVMDEFACEHPDLKFEIDFSDHPVDLVAEGFEMAIRLGQLNDSSYQARRITPIKRMLCASPEYLQQKGIPSSPQALKHHAFIHYGFHREPQVELLDEQGKTFAVKLDPKMTINNGDFMKSMALRGHGICYAPSFLVHQELAKGQLVQVLGDYQLPEAYAYAIYPKNRFLPRRCRLLIDFLVQRFGEQPYWDKVA